MIPKTLAVLAILAFGAHVCDAQANSTCHSSFFQFNPRHSLNTTAYMGEWFMHEIASSNIGNFPAPDYKCSTRSLSIPDVNDLTRLVATDSFVNITNGVTVIESAKDISVNATRSPLNAMWTVTSENETTDVIILAADLEFKQWTVVYSCTIRGPDNFRHEVTTAMTRSRTIDPELRQFLKALMVGTGFRIGDHYPIDQTNC